MTPPTPVSSIPECTSTIKPDSNGWVPPGTCGYYGKMYYPSFTAAATFSSLAAAILLGHLVQAIRHPKSGLQKFAVFASTCILAGYIARTFGTRHQQNIHIAAFSDTMVLVVPILVTAFDCLLFVNTVKFYKRDRNIGDITSVAILRVFVISIPLLTIVQLIACAMIVTGNPPETQQLGIKTYIGTIGIQEALVLCLFGLVIKFWLTMTKANNTRRQNHTWPRWQVISFALYFSLGALFLRIGYRMIELSQVFEANKKLPHNEIFFYAFEATPVLASLSVWTVINTGYLTQLSDRKTDYDYREMHETASEEIIPLSTAQTQELTHHP
ncbi:hypothetical protein B0O99DRAFT_671125 [Bisporella sp. PMI_857]|nr:hypothetical protein B0O99DRAFT_671125 [Bisporella sp. PMI_857]